MAAHRILIVVLCAAALAGQVPDTAGRDTSRTENPQRDQGAGVQPDDNDPDLPKLVCRMALFAQFNADVPGAEKLARHGLALFARNQALETADGAACLTTLAGLLEWKGQPKQAQQQLEQALAIRERLFGPNHALVADTLNRLGLAHFHQGRMSEAEQMHSRAVEILRMQARSSDLAAALNNLGNVLSAQGRPKEAEERIRQAVSIWESLGGADDPSVAAGLTNLGVLLQARKQYDEAGRVLTRARKIDEKAFPKNHPRIGTDLNAAGVLETARKNYREAEDLLVRSAAILEASLSPQHAETGQALLNLAEVYRLEKKTDQARDAFKRGLAAVTSAWGPNDPRLPPWMERFAVVLRAQEDFAGAEELEMRATRIRVFHAIR
jgi:tetratricopeptide (TPR) repeat protein